LSGAADEDQALAFRLDYTLRVAPTAVSPIRVALEQLLGATGTDQDLLHRVTLVVHELLENVAKYSTDGEAHLSLEMAPNDQSEGIVIAVQNHARAEHLARARAMIGELAAAQDSERHYQQLMLSSATRDGSGLGLARIWVEAGMRLSADIEGDRLELRAVS
jgi:hypothetical protein